MSRVLMIDDARLFQMLEWSLLRRAGCDIVRVGSGGEMIERARQDAPDLIVLDAERPAADGTDCLRSLKSDPALHAIPVLVVTSPEGVVGCCDAGADATLSRPVAPGALDLAFSFLPRVSQRIGRRRYTRLPVQIASPEGSLRGRIKDISRRGAFLALPRPLPLRARISLSLSLPLPSGRRSVRAQGEVVRQVPQDPESHLIPGVGVRFVDIDPKSEGWIDHYVEEGIVAGDGPGDDPGERHGA